MIVAVQKFSVALSLMLGTSVKFSIGIDHNILTCAHILSTVTNLTVMHNVRGYI